MRSIQTILAPFVSAWVLCVCAGLAFDTSAQEYWRLSYVGTSTFTNGTAKLVTQPMTDRTLIEQCAQSHGMNNTGDLALVLHLNASALGDALEVVNAADPNQFRCRVFNLDFQESFTNSAGTQVKTFAYIYNNDSDIFGDPSGHSRGSAVITRSVIASKNGTTNTVITGKVQFWLGEWMENAPATNAIVCSGTFTSKGPLTFP